MPKDVPNSKTELKLKYCEILSSNLDSFTELLEVFIILLTLRSLASKVFDPTPKSSICNF